MDLTRISLKELNDYIQCPNFYKYKYIYNLKTSYRKDNLFNKALLRSIYASAFRFMSTGEISYKFVLSRWDRTWWHNVKVKEVLKEEEMQKYSVEAALLLMNFYHRYFEKSDKYLVIAADYTYEVVIPLEGGKNFSIGGSLDLILHNPKKDLSRLIIINPTNEGVLKPGNYFHMNSVLSMDAYLKLNFKYPNKEVLIYHIKKDKESTIQHNTFSMNKVKREVANICKSIHSKLFYPRESTFCNYCMYKDRCGS